MHLVANIILPWYISAMTKKQAIKHLGGTVQLAALAIGISDKAIYKWPDVLTDKLRDRVEAAMARRAKK